MLASEERGAGLYRAQGEREGRTIDIDQLLLFTIRDGLVTEVLALPSDPAAFDAFWSVMELHLHHSLDVLVAARRRAPRRNSTSSRWIREPSISTTRRTSAVGRTSSPTSGARPSAPKTKPAIVW